MKETSEICSAFIAPEIIEHLWTIVELYDESGYVFVLSSRRLGDTRVQDIKIILGSCSYQHSVYGFKPVDFTIKVIRKNESYKMTMIPSARAEYEITKWNTKIFGRNLMKRLHPSSQNFRVRRAW